MELPATPTPRRRQRNPSSANASVTLAIPPGTHDVECLSARQPDAIQLDQTDPSALLAGALAYVERHDGDVLQLELERGPISRALTLAWQRGDHPGVICLVAGLAQIAARFRSFAEAERVLRMGIVASRQTGDGLALARFLNRLGGLLQARGSTHISWAPNSSTAEWIDERFEVDGCITQLADYVQTNWTYAQARSRNVASNQLKPASYFSGYYDIMKDQTGQVLSETTGLFSDGKSFTDYWIANGKYNGC